MSKPVRYKKEKISAKSRFNKLIVKIIACFNGRTLPKWISEQPMSISEFDKYSILDVWNEAYGVQPFLFSFTEIFNIEDLELLVKGLIKFSKSSNSPYYTKDYYTEKILEILNNIDETYKQQSFGELFYYFNKNENLDYIETIRLSFEKSQHNFIIVHFNVTPSNAFLEQYNLLFNNDIINDTYLNINSFKDIKARKTLISGKTTRFIYPKEKINKLILDLNYQIRFVCEKYIKIGFYTGKKNINYPCIISYKYNSAVIDDYIKELRDRIDSDIDIHNIFISDKKEFMFNFPNAKPAVNSLSALHIFADENIIYSPSLGFYLNYKLDEIIHALTGYWIIFNVTNVLRTNVITLRSSFFKYLKEKRDSIYLIKSDQLRACWGIIFGLQPQSVVA